MIELNVQKIKGRGKCRVASRVILSMHRQPFAEIELGGQYDRTRDRKRVLRLYTQSPEKFRLLVDEEKDYRPKLAAALLQEDPATCA